MNQKRQQVQSSVLYTVESDTLLHQIIDEVYEFAEDQNSCFNNSAQSINSNDTWNKSFHENNINLFNNRHFTERMSHQNEIHGLRNSFQQNGQNTSSHYSSLPHTSTSASDPRTIDNVILTQTIPSEYYSLDNSLITSNTMQINQNQSVSVMPIVYMTDPNTNVSSNSMDLSNDILKSKGIQIKCQPRSKFRPRTQNESKNSSHYIRCEEGAEFDYPTISIEQEWLRQSAVNIIEVALVDIEKRAHPYTLDNKNRKNLFDNDTLIWKPDEAYVIYFRLTNEDFVKRYKSFMIELIKSKQDDVITKKLIRLRKLDQSMLRFTRIYKDESGNYQKDLNSETFSCIMTESYGDVSVEFLGPRYGPMKQQDMVFVSFKGRIAKDDISIMITESTSKWCEEITKFTVNGNFIHFQMPSFPFPQLNRVNAMINIYHKKQQICEESYLYTSLLDQELNNSNSDMDTSMTLNQINQLQAGMLMAKSSMGDILQTTSQKKSRKRLND